MAITWDKILDVPEGTVLTDETIDAFILAFEQDGTAKQRGTSGGTYPSETPWTTSDYSIPEGVSFGTKRIPGANPFYFVNKEDEHGRVSPEFGIVEEHEPV